MTGAAGARMQLQITHPKLPWQPDSMKTASLALPRAFFSISLCHS